MDQNYKLKEKREMKEVQGIRATPIRKIKVVVDVEDSLTPILTVDDFKRLFKKEPKTPRYRIAVIECLTCPEDNHVVTPSECGKCPRFVKRFEDNIFCSAKPLK